MEIFMPSNVASGFAIFLLAAAAADEKKDTEKRIPSGIKIFST